MANELREKITMKVRQIRVDTIWNPMINLTDDYINDFLILFCAYSKHLWSKEKELRCLRCGIKGKRLLNMKNKWVIEPQQEADDERD